MKNLDYILSTTTTNNFGETYLYAINGRLFFNTDSNTIFLNKYGKNFLKENSLYVIIGTDSGLFVNFIAKQTIPLGTRIVFVDFKEIIEWTYKYHNLTLTDNIALVTTDELYDHLNSIGIEKYSFLNNINYIQSFCSTDNNKSEYFTLSKKTIEFLQNLQWKTSAQLKNRLFLINQLKNLPDNKVHASFLFGKFKGQSALLLAGGPSLDTFIPWIQQHREEYVVLAVSRISRRLINANITPDIIFSVDPQEISFDVSREMFHFADQSLFIHSYHVFPPMAAQWSGKKAFLGPLFPWPSPLNIPDKVPRGVTVTNVALACALEMGFSQIVLCGVDLCFSSEGHTHASCSKNREQGPVIEGSETKIETNAGTLADTTYAYEIAARHIEFLAQHEIAQDCCVLNPNYYAAKMKGVLYRPIETIRAIQTQKSNTLITYSFSEETTNHLNTIANELKNVRKNLHEIISLSKKAIEENRIFFKRKMNSSRNAKITIDNIESKLHSDKLSDTTNFVKNFGVEYFIRIINMKNVNDITEREAEKSLNDYYNAFIKSSHLLIKLIDGIKLDSEIRNEEQKINKNLSKLFKYYKDNNIPGRYKITFKNEELFLNADRFEKNMIIELKSRFNDILEGKIDYSIKYSENWNEWSDEKEKKLIIKLLEHSKLNDTHEIEKSINIIESSHNKSSAHLALFAKGLLAEIQCNYSEAMGFYSQLIDADQDTTPYLLEITLKRVASISIAINDQENGLLALKCLNDLSIEYAPQYAKLLKLTHRTHDALDVYAQYIEKFPHDIKTMLELATLYSELSIKEGVVLLTGYILERDPDNITAQQLRSSYAQ